MSSDASLLSWNLVLVLCRDPAGLRTTGGVGGACRVWGEMGGGLVLLGRPPLPLSQLSAVDMLHQSHAAVNNSCHHSQNSRRGRRSFSKDPPAGRTLTLIGEEITCDCSEVDYTALQQNTTSDQTQPVRLSRSDSAGQTQAVLFGFIVFVWFTCCRWGNTEIKMKSDFTCERIKWCINVSIRRLFLSRHFDDCSCCNHDRVLTHVDTYWRGGRRCSRPLASWRATAEPCSLLSAPRHGLDYTAPVAAGSSANRTAH